MKTNHSVLTILQAAVSSAHLYFKSTPGLVNLVKILLSGRTHIRKFSFYVNYFFPTLRCSGV